MKIIEVFELFLPKKFMKYLVLLALLASCNVSAQDDDETKDATPDFYYTVQNQLETSKHFAFGLEPLGVGYMGSYVLMSVVLLLTLPI